MIRQVCINILYTSITVTQEKSGIIPFFSIYLVAFVLKKLVKRGNKSKKEKVK